MKHTTLLLLLVFTFTISKSQNHSLLNIGGGYPVFFQSNFNEESGGYHEIGDKRLNVFIEKPGLFRFKEAEGLYITPGISYFFFEEYGSGGGLGGGNSKSLEHQAVSFFGKFIYERKFNAKKSTSIYMGFLSGVYLYSKTTGERSWWRSYEKPPRSGTVEVDESGKHFFNSVYMGVLFGFKPLGNNSSSVIVPVVEVSFFPNYAIIYDDHICESEQKLSKSMIMISLAVGFNTKRNRAEKL